MIQYFDIKTRTEKIDFPLYLDYNKMDERSR